MITHSLGLGKGPRRRLQDVLKEFDLIWSVIIFIMTRNNLVVTWKNRLQMGIISWFPLGLRWFSGGGCILVPFLQLIFQFVPKKKETNYYSVANNSKLKYRKQTPKIKTTSSDVVDCWIQTNARIWLTLSFKATNCYRTVGKKMKIDWKGKKSLKAIWTSVLWLTFRGCEEGGIMLYLLVKGLIDYIVEIFSCILTEK